MSAREPGLGAALAAAAEAVEDAPRSPPSAPEAVDEAPRSAPNADEAVRLALARIRRRVDERTRRLDLLAAMWSAGGVEEVLAVTALRAELGGFAQELRHVGLKSIARAVASAADTLGAYDRVRDRSEPVHLGRRILVLDDSEVTRDVIALALEGAGCEVTVAATLEEYARRVREFGPEVLLIEPAHPQLGGTQRFEVLRNRVRSATVPVILFSAVSEDRLAAWAENAGADGYLTKDQGTDELVSHLEEVLSQVLW